MTKYSQNREEEVIMDKVRHLPTGTVFDIGAHDGKTNSNSLALIERGWSAYLIEPSPSAFLKLLERHAANPKVTLLNAAVGPDTRITKFYEYLDDQCSSTVKENAAKWDGVEGRKMREYWVPQVTVSTILAQLGGGADVLSIDAEGSSVEILRQCPIGSWAPLIICVEHDGRALEMAAWAEERQYEVVHLNAENVILWRRR
jgi:FkbM family methyltransferase